MSWPPKYLTPVPADAFGKRGEVAIEFVENYGIITKDSIAGNRGERLILRDWQKELIRHIYAEADGGYRHLRNLILIPRKNGKSALASTLAIFDLLYGP
jgi:phage terminase large subunit-like protein